MKQGIIQGVALASALTLLTAPALVAAQGNAGENYLRFSGAVLLANDRDIDEDFDDFNFSGDAKFRNGELFSIALGREVTPWLDMEFELGHLEAPFDKLEGRVRESTTGLEAPVSESVSGKMSGWFGFVNAHFRPMRGSLFEPYFGGGIGLASLEEDLEGDTSSDTELALNATLGLDYNIREDVAIGGQYRYIWADMSTTGYGDNAFTASAVSLSLKISF
ncbi:hypothetical protein M911_16380 [Ectothiorhodospira haloalkaliphila]|uniref:Outer membrane protein beta-barrel domain-containing protein n=1 Tax=Ectothiorhodospira haloalkaliphila TaxID=421628 RepID=W8KNT4_9GAMM|nr:outer membrane beta-barrel protein [Ectothiorhodospira haloalkaliphila]AHK80828.1 hypothetical protein M911_16380 [Ectothiorhodospira haloalkaliphila]